MMNDAPPSSRDVVLDEIAGLLRELHVQGEPMPVVRIDARLDRDLGLDSLSRMELVGRLERRLRTTIPEQLAVEAQTPADLQRAFAIPSPPATPAGAEAAIPPADQDIGVPDGANTLSEVLAWHAAHYPERVHVRFAGGDVDGASLTYAELHAAAGETAGGLQRAGLRSGDPVALMFPTHPDLLIAFFGVMLAGGVPVPLYPPLRPGELGEYWRRQSGILRNCGARLMLVAHALYARRRAIGALAGSVERLLTVAMVRQAHALPEPVTHHGDDLAMLQYTSGSTADPKGVMLSHANLLANIRAMGRVAGASAKDVCVSWLPLYHDMGLIGAWLGSLYFGVPLVLMPPQSFLLHPAGWLRAIDRFGATLSAAPNFAYELCLHRIEESVLDGLDLGRLRICFCGAEPVVPETMERFIARFGRCGLSPGALLPVYGLAENSLGLTFPPPGRGLRVLRVQRDRFLRDGDAVLTVDPAEPSLRFVSCGAPLPGNELRIVDEHDHERPDGRQGHVQFRGPSASTGYFRNPAPTRQLLHGDWRDTGDLGFLADGELYLSGRTKDVIIRAGQHLHPQGIEQAVGEVPGVRRGRVAAFGTHGGGTERLIVVAETRLADPASRDALRQSINAAVQACTGAPADDIVLAAPGAVLKTSSGKLRRSACRAAYETGRLDAPDRLQLWRVMARAQRDRLRRQARHAALLAYGAYAWTLLGLAAMPMLVSVALPMSHAARWRVVQRVLRMVAAAVGIGIRSELAEAPPGHPCVFVCNHASYIDALVLLCALPRPVAFVAKQELAAQPVLGWALRRFGVLFVARTDLRAGTRAVQAAQAAAGDLLFFPEGTLRRMPGLLHFRLGAFATAAASGMPVVPVTLKGTRAVLPDGQWLPQRGVVTVTVGAAIHSRKTDDRWHEALRLAAAARARMLKLCGEPDAAEVRLDLP
jgi:1-acyl-sn-glycerol-3-phosphate acyltransferase